MKIIYGILVLIATVFSFSTTILASENNTNWKYKEWETEKLDNNEIRIITHGSTVWGHEFGFIRSQESCKKNVLWLAWSTHEKGLSQYEDKHVEFAIKVDDKVYNIKVKLLTVFSLTPNSSTQIAIFTNFVANDEFIDILKHGNKLEISIIGPKEVVKKFDIPWDTFSLDGFTANYNKSIAVCKNQDVLRRPPKPQDTSSTNRYSNEYIINGNGEECRIRYDTRDKTIIESSCISLFNSKGIKIYCTKNKKMCKTQQEVDDAVKGTQTEVPTNYSKNLKTYPANSKVYSCKENIIKNIKDGGMKRIKNGKNVIFNVREKEVITSNGETAYVYDYYNSTISKNGVKANIYMKVDGVGIAVYNDARNGIRMITDEVQIDYLPCKEVK